MQAHTQAGIIVVVGALVPDGGYIMADGADAVPGVLILKPPLPRAAASSTPKAVSPTLNQAPLFNTNTVSDPTFLKNLTRKSITDYRTRGMKVLWWISTLDGVELASANSDLALAPAPTTKLFTAATTLHDFGSIGRAHTVMAWDESVRKPYLIEGGDIPLGTGAGMLEDIFGYTGLGALATNTVQALTKHSKGILAQAPYTLVVDAFWFGTEKTSST